MTLPNTIATWTRLARTTIERIHVLSRPGDLANVDAALRNLRAYLVVTEDHEQDFRAVHDATDRLGHLLRAAFPGDSEIAIAKQKAIGAIMGLTHSLKSAQATEEADFLGLD